MDVCLADRQDLADLARLVWLNAAPDEQVAQSVEGFAVDLEAWWTGHGGTHLAFGARHADTDPHLVGMAWLALVPRVPRSGNAARRSAEIQSLFVLPEWRGQGIGAALVRAASEHAVSLGASRVTVHSGRRSVPLYERLGFSSSRQLLQRPPD